MYKISRSLLRYLSQIELDALIFVPKLVLIFTELFLKIVVKVIVVFGHA
jgi:flagellar biosynthesis protein FliQ